MALNKSDTGDALSWLTFAAVGAAVFLAGRFRLPEKLCAGLNYLGELSYPLYLFHVPLCLALFHFARIRGGWTFVGLVLLLTAALNQVFDHWTKDLFWKPVLRWLLPARRPARGGAAAVPE